MTTETSYEVSSYNITDGKTTSRTVTPLPTPERIQPKSITKGELTELISELRAEMGDAQEKFDNREQLDAERNSKRQELIFTISELTLKLRQAQLDLDDLERIGSVRSQFITFAKQAETRITSIATGVYNFLLERFSLERYEAKFSELTPVLKEEVLFKVNRSGIRGLTQPSFVRLHRSPDEQVTDTAIGVALNRVYDATDNLKTALEKK